MRTWWVEKGVVVRDSTFVFLEGGFQTCCWYRLGSDEVQWRAEDESWITEKGRTEGVPLLRAAEFPSELSTNFLTKGVVGHTSGEYPNDHVDFSPHLVSP
jgi:hypothetical protein